uniref:Uncharacterized protein n=1 Tax=Daphnia galeata TaxID=27404 RepID=A0A8J2RW28_9CRUS|nr:unnamed protein product [Daphnia galeata]
MKQPASPDDTLNLQLITSTGVQSVLDRLKAVLSYYTSFHYRLSSLSVKGYRGGESRDRPAAVQRQSALRSSIPLNVLIFGLNFLLLQMPLQDR